jgi:CRISPR-associated protein Cas1
LALSLHDLSWHRVSLTLVNTRNTFAREHPLSIFEGMFKRAASLPGRELCIEYLFHPVDEALPARVQKKKIYRLEIVFLRADLNAISQFVDNLHMHLKDSRNNFLLQSISEPQKRSLHDLEQEAGGLPVQCTEICLEFLTPFPFTPADRKKEGRHWRNFLSTNAFFGKLAEHVVKAFALPDDVLSIPSWDHVEILPYYWNYQQFTHVPKSNQGRREYINGTVGPLYIKGKLDEVYPLLMLCSEINASPSSAKGRGHYVLRFNRPYFDDFLRERESLDKAFDIMERESDIVDELQTELIEADSFLGDFHQRIVEGSYQPAPFHGFHIAGSSRDQRLIATAAARDSLLLKMLHLQLEPVFDRMFEDCSIGFRRGRSRGLAKKEISKAMSSGYTHLLKSDIESFFDEISWDSLLATLRNVLPRADTLTFSLLERFIKADLLLGKHCVNRTQGLIQGMALSPLLANLYLDSFDEEMTAMGYWMIRYGDDFVVMARSKADAEQAQHHASAILARLGLDLKEEKTTVISMDEGFTFLGIEFGLELDEGFIENAALRKTLYLRNLYAFVGIDGDSVVIKIAGKLHSRIPLYRVSEIVIYGNNSLSSRLLQRCSTENIPVTFCQAGGRYVNTLRPDSKQYFEVNATHFQRFHRLNEAERLVLAKRIATAKISAYVAWFSDSFGKQGRSNGDDLLRITKLLVDVDKVESVRGHEGDVARAVYQVIRGAIRQEDTDFFRFGKRQPKKKLDPYNMLLDYASFLLFSRINVLVRSLGLSPYLGFLHSHKDNFESLVCDLQEPFRARMDRFVLRCVNIGVIKQEHFKQPDQEQRYWLTHEGQGRFIEAFERELQKKYAGDPGTLRQLLLAQVEALRLWAGGEKQDLVIYRSSVETA